MGPRLRVRSEIYLGRVELTSQSLGSKKNTSTTITTSHYIDNKPHKNLKGGINQSYKQHHLPITYSQLFLFFSFFFKQKTAYEIRLSLVGSEMCIRDRLHLVVEN